MKEISTTEKRDKSHELLPPFYTIRTWSHSQPFSETTFNQGSLQEETRVSNCKCGHVHPVDKEGKPDISRGLCTTCKVFKPIGPHGLETEGCQNCFLIGCL